MPKILHVKLPLQTRLTWSKSHLLVVEKKSLTHTHACILTLLSMSRARWCSWVIIAEGDKVVRQARCSPGL